MEYRNVVEMFRSQVVKYGDRPFIRHKREEKWLGVTWREMESLVLNAALGLIGLGLKPGEAVGILSENRWEWLVADLGVVSAAGVTAAVYSSNTPRDAAYIVDHCEARVLFVQNARQLAKILEMSSELKRVEHIVAFDPVPGATDPRVLTFDELLRRGAEASTDIRAELDRRVAALGPDDTITYIYTSGTTGPPKGAILTHGNVTFICAVSVGLGVVTEQDESLSFLPFAHALERLVFYISMLAGGTVWMAESVDKVMDNLAEVHPTVTVSVPRMFEKIYEAIQQRVAAMPPRRRRIFLWAVAVGRKHAAYASRGRKAPICLRVRYAVADKLVFRKLKAVVGGRIRNFVVGGAPMAPELDEFYFAVGMPVLIAYGMTETCAPATVNLPGDVHFDTVGRPIPGVDVAIAPDGEIIMRGPSIFKGYFKDPVNTATTLIDGWCHSGDLGELTPDGHLRITGRKKDLIITAGGKNIAPQNLEFHFSQNPAINQIVITGDSKPYLTALITLNRDIAERMAAESGRPGDFESLVSGIVTERNSSLARFEQIKKFRILDHEFTQETGEMTPTLKIKRNVVFARYADLIEKMYAEEK